MSKVGLIAKYWNEEILLPNWLRWLDLLDVDHILLGDDGSTDKSADICRNHSHIKGETHNYTLEHPHEGYFNCRFPERQKVDYLLNEAFRLGCNWVIHLDIDEFPTTNLVHCINGILKKFPSKYGIYCPIVDLYKGLTDYIIANLDTNYSHYPCPHLKIFGDKSGYCRIVDGLKLDPGVTGGNEYFVEVSPYLHLKGLFKNRRIERGMPLYGPITPRTEPKYLTRTTYGINIPIEIAEWYKSFTEPDYVW